jgi:hypothetical protein
VEAVAEVSAEIEIEAAKGKAAKSIEAKAKAEANIVADAQAKAEAERIAMPNLNARSNSADMDEQILEVVTGKLPEHTESPANASRRMSKQIAGWSREDLNKLKSAAKQGLRDQWARMHPGKIVPEKVRIDRLSGEELQEMWEGISVLVGNGREWGECKIQYALLKKAKKARSKQRAMEVELVGRRSSRNNLPQRRSSRQNNLPKRRSSRQAISLPDRRSSRRTIIGVMDSAAEAAELAEAQRLRAVNTKHENELQNEMTIKRSLHVEKAKKRLQRRRSSISMGLVNGTTSGPAQGVGVAIRDAVKRAEDQEAA